jgi:hypothetical protein
VRSLIPGTYPIKIALGGHPGYTGEINVIEGKNTVEVRY